MFSFLSTENKVVKGKLFMTVLQKDKSNPEGEKFNVCMINKKIKYMHSRNSIYPFSKAFMYRSMATMTTCPDTSFIL